MNDEPQNQGAGDLNVERLVREAYRPELAGTEFVERVGRAMNEAGRAGAASRQVSWWARPATSAALSAAALVVLGIGLWLSGREALRPKGETVRLDTVQSRSPSIATVTARSIASERVMATPRGEEILGLVARQRPPSATSPILAAGRAVETKAGEKRRLTLEDGSTLLVNQGSKVVVESARAIRVEAGGAFVEVAQKESGERFVVRTPGREVVAMGTKFAVNVDKQGTGVVVTQGKVKVSGVAQELRAGMAVDAGGVVASAPRASAVLDWTAELMELAQSPLVPASSYAGGALVAKGSAGQESRLDLRKYHVDVHIEDGFARTTIDQTYFNHDTARLEGTFYFPLPPDAALSRLAMYVDGRLMEGGMAERDTARVVYETIVHTRKDPALLEWVDGSTFKMRVFPLEGRQEKRIVISYVQRLSPLYGPTTYRFPQGHSLGDVREWSFHARAKGGGAMSWASPSHPMTESRAGQDLLLDVSARNVKADRDVVIELADSTGQPGLTSAERARFSSQSFEGAQYLMLRYRPELAGDAVRQRRDWVFLFESSAARDPLLARAQIDVIRTILENAEHDDTFAIVTAGTRTRAFTEAPVPVTAENVRAAVGFLERTHLVGAMDLGKALDAAGQFAAGSQNAWLVHVGGGIATLGERREDALASRVPSGARYVGIGVGKRWSRQFMKTAAGRSGGYFTQINPDENVAWRAFDLLAALNTPRLMNLKVTDPSGQMAFLNHADSLAQGEELCAVTRLEGGVAIPTSLVVTGLLNGQPWNREIPVARVTPDAGHLPRTWAKLEIDRLLAAGAEANRAKIVELSKSMYVMSPFTSLLVLETEQMYEQFKVDRGRKDHWAMYPCPDRIPVVHEPLAAPTAAVTTQPAGADRSALEECLRSILVRGGTRPLHWPGESPKTPGTTAYAIYLGEPPATVTNMRTWSGDSVLPPALGDGSGWPDEQMPLYNYWYMHNWDVNGPARDLTVYFDNGRADFVPNPFLNTQRYSIFTTADFGNVVAHYRARGRDGLHLLDGGVVGYTRGHFERDQLEREERRAQELRRPEVGVANRRRTVAALVERSQDQVRRRNYEQALGVLDQILILDPDNDYARGARPLVSDSFALQSLRGWRERHDREVTNVLSQAEERRIPYEDILRYPENWPDISELRDGEAKYGFWMFRGHRGEVAAVHNIQAAQFAEFSAFYDRSLLRGIGLRSGDLAVQSSLDKRLPEINFTGQGLADVVDFFRDVSGANIFVNWRALEAAGINKDAAVNAHLKDIRFSKALQTVLDNTGGGNVKLTYATGDGVLTITTGDDLARSVVTRVYDIRDLLVEVPDFDNAPDFSLESSGGTGGSPRGGRGGGGGGGGGYAGGLFGERRELRTQSSQQRADVFAKLVQETVDPTSWREAGGSIGSVRARDGQLIVTQTPENQRGLANLLEQLRETRNVVVATKAGFGPNQLSRSRVLRYEPPVLNTDLAFLHDLVAYAPGFHTTSADVAAVVENEVPQPSSTSRARGKIDPAAQRLIDRARSTGWVSVKLPSGTLRANGGGRFVFDHTTRESLREQIVCDGRTLWHLYPELGLASRRDVSRFHRAQIAELLPWHIPPADDLAIASNVRTSGDDVVVLEPVLDSPATRSTTAPATAPAPTTAPSRRIELRFADGRLVERRATVGGRTLARQTYGDDGSILTLDGEAKELRRDRVEFSPCEAPASELAPDLKQYVVLPMPYRTRERVLTSRGLKDDGQYARWGDDARLAVLASELAGGGGNSKYILDAFFTPGDRRLGLYVLLLSMRGAANQANVPADGRPLALDPRKDHPKSDVARHVDRMIRRARGEHVAASPVVAGDGFGARILVLGEVFSGMVTSDDRQSPESHEAWRAKALDLARKYPTTELTWAALRLVREKTGPSPELSRAIADAALRLAGRPGFALAARYEAARALHDAGDDAESRRIFTDWYRQLAAMGAIPAPDGAFCAAFLAADDGKAELARLMSETSKALVDQFGAVPAIELARVLRSQGPQLEGLAGKAFERAVSAIGDKPDDVDVEARLAAAGYLSDAADWPRAERMLAPLLESPIVGRVPALWRTAAYLAEKRGSALRSAQCLERALDLEFTATEGDIRVQSVREQYGALLGRYEKLAEAVAALDQTPSDELVARVVRSADRWRALDPEPAQVCQTAARVLRRLGRKELAWEYLTTPLAERSNEAGPWQSLAAELARDGEVSLADQAYATAFDVEPTNAQVLWDRAQMLQRHGRSQDARAVYRKLAEGTWQPRFQGLAQQAKAYLNN